MLDLGKNINTVGELRNALKDVPDSALLNIGTREYGFSVDEVHYDGMSVALETEEEGVFEPVPEGSHLVALTTAELEKIRDALNFMGDNVADREGYSSGEEYWDLKEKLEVLSGAPSEERNPENKVSLGDFAIPELLDRLADNAFYGKKPTSMRFADCNNVLELRGYIYEPGYEYFSATASIALNGHILYGIDSRNVGPYRNETYQTGIYGKLEDAISHLDEMFGIKNFVLISEKKRDLDEQIRSAAGLASSASGREKTPGEPER